MKKIFIRNLSVGAIIILFVGIAVSAYAQTFTKQVIASTGFFTAMTRDGADNIYVIRSLDGTHSEVEKCLAGQTTFTAIFTGLIAGTNDETGGTMPWGLAVSSLGDVCITTNFSSSNTLNGAGGNLSNTGNIIKLASNNGFNGTSYTPTVIHTGRYYTGLAFDSSNNLYAIQMDAGFNNYTVTEYTSLAVNAAGTQLFANLNDNALDNYPQNVAIASNLDIYVTNAIRTLSGTTGSTATDGVDVRKYTKASSYGSFTQVSAGKFATALALDPSGNLYVSETDGSRFTNYRLNKYTNGAGSPTQIIALDEGAGMSPMGIAAVSSGNIYVLDGNNPGAVWRLFGAPGTPASSVSFSNIGTTTATVSWTNGDGTNRAVFMANTTTGGPTPVNNTTYTANATFGSGTQSTAGWFCIYNGTGTSVPVTGLTQGQTYRVKVFEYNGTTGSQNYLQSDGSNNPFNVTTKSPTTINSINRVTGQFTNASSVNFLATFGTTVTGVTASNFSVTATGVTGVTNANIGTPTTGDGGITWTVPVTTGTGNGTIQLNLANATGLSKTITTSLPFAGQTYTLYKVTNTNDHFRTKNTTGNWATATDWESSADNSFFITATTAPSSTATDVTVQTGHTINISTAQTASAITMSGMINITGQTLTVTGAITGAGGGKYIKTNGGILKMNVTNVATKIFPVGNSAYNPLSITNNTGAADDFSVQVSDEVVGASGHTITQPHVKRTWDIAKTNPNGGSGINLIFNWNSGENNAVISTPALYHFVSPTWVKQTGTTSSTTTSLTYTGYTGTFSPFAIGDAATPLPLNLLSFTGAVQPSGTVLLQWQTAQETNTDHFEIDRSFDGKDFTAIGRQDAANNSSTTNNYTFTDQSTDAQHSSASKRYYRLKVVDLNGDFTYSNTLSINNDATSAGDVTVYPNPVTDHLSIRVNDWTQVKQITLTDNAGKVLIRNTTILTDLPMGQYPTGIYHLSVLKTDGEIISKQVMKGK